MLWLIQYQSPREYAHGELLKLIFYSLHETALGSVIPAAMHTEEWVTWQKPALRSAIAKSGRYAVVAARKSGNATFWKDVLFNCQAVRVCLA
jgi:hypothetical protein